MNNNKQQQKSFANVISKEDFDKLKDKETFFLENDIYIECKRRLPYTDKETYIDSYDFNPELANQIIDEFHFFMLDNNESNKTINQLKYILKNALNRNDKKQFIKEQIEEHYQKIHKLDIVSYLTKSRIDINPELTSFYKLMISNILRNEDIIVDYITKGEKISFLKHLLFKDWFDLVQLFKIIIFLENPEQKKSFANLISKENYDRLKSQRQFEIDNEIIIPTTYEMDLPDGEVYENTLMLLNPLLVDEILNNYIIEKKIDDNCEFNNHVNKISIKLNVAINDKTRINILNKEYQKYLKKLRKIDLTEDLYRVNKSLNPKSKEFIDLIKNTIANEEYIYIDFITKGCNMNFYKHWLFKEWNDVELYSNILEYLKEKINLLQTNNQQQSNNELTAKQQTLNNDQLENIINNESDTFKYTYSEDLFMHLLKSTGAIKQDKTIRTRKFIPVCDAIYTTDLGKLTGTNIFKEVLTKNEYADFIRDNFEVKINKNNKFSTGKRYTTSIQNHIKTYLKKHNLYIETK